MELKNSKEKTPQSLEEAEAIDEQLIRMADNFFINNPSYTLEEEEQEEVEEGTVIELRAEEEEEETVVYDPATGGVFQSNSNKTESSKEEQSFVMGEFEKTMQRVLFSKMNDKVNKASKKVMETLSDKSVPYYAKQGYQDSINKTNKELRDIFSVVALEDDVINSKKLPEDYRQDLKTSAYHYVSTLFDFAENFTDYKKMFESMQEEVTTLHSEVERLEKQIKELKGE